MGTSVREVMEHTYLDQWLLKKGSMLQMPPPSQPTLLNGYEDCINVIIDNCQREQPADAT